jgi:hypothetical protein
MIHTIFSFIYIAAGVVFLFGAAIFVHEFGHYWVARRRGLKVGPGRNRVFDSVDSRRRLRQVTTDGYVLSY